MADFSEFEHALTTKQAGAYLGLSPGSLAVMRSRKAGPPCTYSGSRPVYYLSELKRWQAECRAAREAKSARQADGRTSQDIESKGRDYGNAEMVGKA
jgi:hypothetical protein